MSKIISLFIKFLNRINKIIWKICIFLSNLIPIEEIDKLNDKPTNERYRHFKVDEQPIIEPFIAIEHKDHKQLIKATYYTLSKYDVLPKDLKVISDGNPIYNVAVQYWTQHHLPFKLYQVIGLTNQDDISKEYRSQKQIIERHNRTLKYYYRPKGRFTSLDNANSYMILFSTCFNFLRPHSALKYKVPVEIPELRKCTNMPNK